LTPRPDGRGFFYALVLQGSMVKGVSSCGCAPAGYSRSTVSSRLKAALADPVVQDKMLKAGTVGWHGGVASGAGPDGRAHARRLQEVGKVIQDNGVRGD